MAVFTGSTESMKAIFSKLYLPTNDKVLKIKTGTNTSIKSCRTGLWNSKDIQNSHQSRSKNKLVRENAVIRAHGS